ncbi:hypothetical protein [Catellatospora paridis]|uniref:hypothetical protein n=1 Tax=Catellatospora paridis TaxID=1617086 RepID=UPI0012D45214|nr:hypothetical protein [Catellatospora paridis]
MTYPRPEADAAAIRRFFTKEPTKPDYTSAIVQMAFGGAALLVGLVCAAGGATMSTDLSSGIGSGLCCSAPFFIAAAVLGLVGGLAYRSKLIDYQQKVVAANPKPPVEWVRAHLQSDLARIEQRALQELRISREDLQLESDLVTRRRQEAIAHGQDGPASDDKQPLTLLGPARRTVIAYDASGSWALFSRSLVSVICPTSWQFGIYECILELDTGRLTAEQAKTYPYSQVAAVTTRTVPLQWPTTEVRPIDSVGDELHWNAVEYRDLEVLVSGGDRAVVSLGLVDQESQKNYQSLLMPDANKVIDEVKAALRRRDVS